MQKGTVDIIPGGMNTDVIENLLGQTEFQSIKNMRMRKEGEWVNDTAWVALKTGLSGVKSGIEITDDLSGDRFILYHSGTKIYRLDYDDGDGNGYENETASTLFESGVTISDVTLSANSNLRFFFYNGIVRITGASAVLRYEYIDRTLFSDCISINDRDWFASTVESWTGTDASVTNGSNGPNGKYALDVTQTGLNGRAKKTFTIVSGESYTLRAWIKNSTGGQVIACGTSDDGSDYGTFSTVTNSEWVKATVTFTATGTSLYVYYNPSTNGSAETGYLAYVVLEKAEPVTIADWVLTKAEIEAPSGLTHIDGIHILNGSTTRYTTLKVFAIYDSGQYSLLADLDKDTDWSGSLSNLASYINVLLKVPFTLFTNNKRITGLCVVGSVSTVADDETTNTDYFYEILDFETGLSSVTFGHPNMRFKTANQDRLFLYSSGTGDFFPLYNGLFMPGNRIELENSNGTAEGEIIQIGESDNSDPENAGSHLNMFQIDGPVDGVVASMASDEDLPTTKITITRRLFLGYDYDISGETVTETTDYLLVWTLLNLTAGTDYYDFTGLPAGTSDIFYNYSHFGVMDNQAFILSSETGEGDLIRWSPEYQFDVFPSAFYGQTEIGDRDENRALVIRDGRAAVLKKKSISQVQVLNGNISEDVGIAQRGLYANNLYTVIDSVLIFGDENDILVFNGINVEPWLTNERVRQYYRDNVNSSSTFLYNKLRNEFWAVLNGVILAYQFDFKRWIILDYSTGHPINGFLSFDNELIGIISTGFINFNHSSATFGEAIQSYFKAMVTDLQNPEQFKKVIESLLYCECSTDVTVTLTDNIEAGSKVITFTPNATKETVTRDNSTLMFKEFECELQTESSATLDFVFRWLKILVGKWR